MSVQEGCANAGEYAVKRLRESEGLLSPAELAEEYDCSGKHMRSVLSDLAEGNVVERVARGRYDVAGAYADGDLRIQGAGNGELEVADDDGEDTDQDTGDGDAQYRRQWNSKKVEIEDTERAEAPSAEGAATSGSEGGSPLSGGTAFLLASAAFVVLVFAQVQSTSSEGDDQDEPTGSGGSFFG